MPFRQRHRRLPPLNALRAFEAAARHLSFSAAAEELNVTLSAVSHQIRHLEEVLGVPLFLRSPRGLRLSEEGALLLPGFTLGFDHLAEAVAKLADRKTEGVIAISMLSTFAMHWFIPRLPHFQGLHPDIDVRIATSSNPTEIDRDGFDCAIRYGTGEEWPGQSVTRLFAETLVPVCTPALAQSLATPADLLKVKRLHARLRRDDWALWAVAAGLISTPGFEPSAGPIFDTRSLVIQAALQGLGVAVLDPILVADHLDTGRLVRPFDVSSLQGGAYWLVCPPARAETPRLRALRSWLLDEARQG
jgi:DNA-binding transcriptional LysR family regulator